jgi:hypothetical protein
MELKASGASISALGETEEIESQKDKLPYLH